jgi:hypothetical protein
MSPELFSRLEELLTKYPDKYKILVTGSQLKNRLTFRDNKVLVHPSKHEKLLNDIEKFKSITKSPLYKALL